VEKSTHRMDLAVEAKGSERKTVDDVRRK